jgi:hypothetical protein
VNKLAYYLRRTAGRIVNVKYEQVVELIGEEKANELAIYKVKKQEMRSKHAGKRSAIPQEKRYLNEGLAGFDRKPLLDAILAAQGMEFQMYDKFGKPPEPLPNAAPDVTLITNPKLKKEMEQKLASRGLAPVEE